jgi:hypothetical protein
VHDYNVGIVSMNILVRFKEKSQFDTYYIWVFCKSCSIRKIVKNVPFMGIVNCVKCGSGCYVDVGGNKTTKILCA